METIALKHAGMTNNSSATNSGPLHVLAEIARFSALSPVLALSFNSGQTPGGAVIFFKTIKSVNRSEGQVTLLTY